MADCFTVEHFRTAGWGGHYVCASPELKLIVVFTPGGFYDTSPLNVNDIIEHFSFQAVID